MEATRASQPVNRKRQADGERYTEEQRLAIETRDTSVSLSAGAGCGKTFVLTERFLSHFEPGRAGCLAPEELGRLVAITFTDRAAREMRERVRSRCHQRLLDADSDQAPHWASMLRWLDAARISTIHSFCAVFLRSRAVDAGLDPSFRVLEQAQAETLLSAVIEDVLRELIGTRDVSTIELAVRFDLRDLKEMLRSLAAECSPLDFDSWRQTTPEKQVAVWRAAFEQEVVSSLGENVSQHPAARTLLDLLTTNVPSNAVMAERRLVILDKLKSLEAPFAGVPRLKTDLDALHEAARVQKGGGASAWPSAEVYEAVKSAADKLRAQIGKAHSALEFDEAAALEAARLGLLLFEIAERIAREYRARKAELNGLDFNDLLSRTHALLDDPQNGDMRRRLAQQIELLLVDEFQDTDPVQVRLVKALCGDQVAQGKLFFVGDYKQSIYRFRGAEPKVFSKLRDSMSPAGRQALTRNFRSQPAILTFVNALFWDDLGNEYEPLRPSRPQVGPPDAVEFLWAGPDEEQGEEREEVDALRRREAAWMARRIRALVESNEPVVFDTPPGGPPRARPAKWGDIAILFRALSDVAIYEEALQRQEIDYYVVGGHAFYAQQEIFDLLNLLRVIANPTDHLSLVGALRSPLFALSDEAIFWLAQHSDGLWAGMTAAKYRAELEAEQVGRARAAAETLVELRNLRDRLPICELIELALDRTGYDATLLAEFMGERKLANLRKLTEQARQFQHGGSFGLHDFINQLSEFVARQPEEALAATHSEYTNVVRLMTIHQAKGLEFPVVIVPDMNRPRQNQGPRAHFDKRLGPLVQVNSDRYAEAVGGYALWRQLERAEEADELNRLLYVATTRAADYLILSSGVKQLGENSGPWMQLLSRRFDLLTGKLLAKLPKDEPQPRVNVITVEPVVAAVSSSKRRPLDFDAIKGSLRVPQPSTPERFAGMRAIAPNVAARQQYSFSRLSGALERGSQQAVDAERPYMTPAAALDLGVVVHAVLAAVDFRRPGDLKQLVALHARRQGARGIRHEEEALEIIERFMASSRARELANADESYAELDFLLAWPLEKTGERPITIAGAIDRLYRDRAGNWHVLDFKTNRLDGQDIPTLAANYELQMLVYALAVERIWGAPPAELTLHFLRSGQEHSFAWDAEARQKVARMVDDALAADRTVAISTAGVPVGSAASRRGALA
ncbi:MAG TPA: UvrD-helicase domain-containing protein [Pirellulales bacterium]|nr:UvrD-helicase domain-containing protein [Pirellulales bacterium]